MLLSVARGQDSFSRGVGQDGSLSAYTRLTYPNKMSIVLGYVRVRAYNIQSAVSKAKNH